MSLRLSSPAPLWLDGAQRERLADDALREFFDVSDWRFAGGEYAYTLIFTDPPPFQHFHFSADRVAVHLSPAWVGLPVIRLGNDAGRWRLAGAFLVGSVAIVVSPVRWSARPSLLLPMARAAELACSFCSRACARRHRGRAGAAARLLPVAVPSRVRDPRRLSQTDVADAWLYRGAAPPRACLGDRDRRRDGTERSRRGVTSVAWLRWIGCPLRGLPLSLADSQPCRANGASARGPRPSAQHRPPCPGAPYRFFEHPSASEARYEALVWQRRDAFHVAALCTA